MAPVSMGKSQNRSPAMIDSHTIRLKSVGAPTTHNCRNQGIKASGNIHPLP